MFCKGMIDLVDIFIQVGNVGEMEHLANKLLSQAINSASFPAFGPLWNLYHIKLVEGEGLCI